MFELEKSDEINKWIAMTKSDSGWSGPELARAHIELGMALGNQMKGFDRKDTTVVAMLRGGIFFAEGIYFALGCKFQIYDPKHDDFVRPKTRNVILADSVISTGKTMLKIWDRDMKAACCVINEAAVPLFGESLNTVRVSKNTFVGKNVNKQEGRVGPDTTMRLFNQLEQA